MLTASIAVPIKHQLQKLISYKIFSNYGSFLLAYCRYDKTYRIICTSVRIIIRKTISLYNFIKVTYTQTWTYGDSNFPVL